jgi:cell division protein FtsB
MANKRKRKSQSGAVRLVPAIKAIVLCALIGGSCVGYVLQKNQIYDLGQQIRAREEKLRRLKMQNNIRAGQLATLQLPQNLAERARALNLGLVPPHPSQIIWLPEPVVPAVPESPGTSETPLLVIQQPARHRIQEGGIDGTR